jgi:hypothetical protein
MWGAVSDERRGLPFTIAAGPRQRSHSWVRVPRDPWPYFNVSDLRLPQPGGAGPRIYIPEEQGGPVITPGTGFPFRRLLRLAGLWLRYANPPSKGVLQAIIASSVLLITPLHGPSRNHRSNNNYFVACGSVAAGTCLPSRCLEAALHSAIWSSRGSDNGYYFVECVLSCSLAQRKMQSDSKLLSEFSCLIIFKSERTKWTCLRNMKVNSKKFYY